MNTYSPEQEPAGTRAFLIVVKAEYDTIQIKAQVIRHAVAHTYDDNGVVKKCYDSKDGKGYRFASWSGNKKNSLFLENYTVSAWIRREDLSVFGVTSSFRDLYQIEMNEAKAIVNTLTKIQASTEKQARVYGWPDSADYAGNLLRIASALGITQFLTYVDNAKGGSLETSDFRTHNATYLYDVITNMIEKAVKK